MDEKQIQQILKSQRRADPRSTFGCPEENWLASYVDGQLTGNQRTAFERHFSDCQSCLAAIAFLTRAAEWDSKEVPPYLIARARALVTEKPATVWRWRWAVATAAAACLLLALSFVLIRSRQQPVGLVDGPLVARNQETPEAVTTPIVKPPTVEPPRPLPTRSVTKPNSNGNDSAASRGTHDEFKPRLLFPSEGSSVRRHELVFRWEPAADAVFYKVRLVTIDGSLIREIETKEPTLKLGNDVQLREDAKYYVTVVAHSSDGHETISEIVSFRLIKD
jgi:hypothetical protein